MARIGSDENKAANKTNQEEKTTSFLKGQQAIQQAQEGFDKLRTTGSVGVNPWKSSDYLANENKLQAESIDQNFNSSKAAMQRQNLATGGLNGSVTPLAIRDSGLQSARLADQLTAERSAADFDKNVGYQTSLATMPLGIAGAESPYFGTSTQGQSSALGNLAQMGIAQYGPYMAAISAAGQAAGAACPVEGSLYLMADGSEKPVEKLVVGEQIMGVDDEPQTIEEIQSGRCFAIQVRTENGCLVRNSPTHAFVLPKGGFTVAARSMDKSILTDKGPSKVISIEPAGLALVFNVITDGSHSYRADGVWALGVGEAERNVSMDEWRQIGEQLFKDRTKWAGGTELPRLESF